MFIYPSSVPSDASRITASISAYVTSWELSLRPVNFISPIMSESAGLAEFLYSLKFGPTAASVSVVCMQGVGITWMVNSLYYSGVTQYVGDCHNSNDTRAGGRVNQEIPASRKECLEFCLAWQELPALTGCMWSREWNQCRSFTEEVVKGDGRAGRVCWVLSSSGNVGGNIM